MIRGAYDSSSRCCGDAFDFEDYSAKGIVIRNSDIQGMNNGVEAPSSGFGPGPNLSIENSYLRNWTNVWVPTPSSVNGCWMQDKLIAVVNTRLEAPPGRSLSALRMEGLAAGTECLAKLDELRVYAYNGNPSDNFQVYHSSSSVVPRPPSSCSPDDSSRHQWFGLSDCGGGRPTLSPNEPAGHCSVEGRIRALVVK